MSKRLVLAALFLFGCQEPESAFYEGESEIDWSLWEEKSHVEFFLPENVGMVSIANHTFVWDNETHQWIRQDETDCALHTEGGGDE